MVVMCSHVIIRGVSVKNLAFRGQEASFSPTPHPEVTIITPARENLFSLTGTNSRLLVTEGSEILLSWKLCPGNKFSSWALQLLKLHHLSPESLLCFANEEPVRKICSSELAKF